MGYIEIASSDPRLKRRINHDPRSWNYRVDTSGLSVTDVEWQIHLPVLDQGQIGRCTAMSACEVLGMDPFWGTVPSLEDTLSQHWDDWTKQFYSDEETTDGDGPYPPNDNGSDGLTAGKVAKARGLVSGYLHAMSAQDALLGMQKYPALWGTLWKTGMDNVNTTTGQVKYSGSTRGGHELSLYKIDAAKEQVWFHNHWGAWGYQNSGVAWISFTDFEKSLADQGDVTFFVPLSQPAPNPNPGPGNGHIVSFSDSQFSAISDWAAEPHVFRKSTAAAKAWKQATSG